MSGQTWGKQMGWQAGCGLCAYALNKASCSFVCPPEDKRVAKLLQETLPVTLSQGNSGNTVPIL